LAESSLSNVSGLGESGLRRWSSDNVQRYRILQGGTRRVLDIQQQVISQMLLPWTNVFCLFVDTQSDIRDACQLLKRPRQTVTIGSQSIPDLMRIVVVLTGAQNHGIEDLSKASHELHATDRLSKDVTVLDLRDRYELSLIAAFEPLRRLILNEI
jgi:predicted nucleic acid-binding protein